MNNNTRSKIGTALGTVVLGALTGCLLPGHHGGPHGVPGSAGMPGLSGVQRKHPVETSPVVATGEGSGRNKPPQLVQDASSLTQ